MKSVNYLMLFFFFPLTSSVIFGDSGGVLSPQQAAYDVIYYDLDLSINPDKKTISGSLLLRAEIVDNFDSLVVDLDSVFNLDSVLVRTGSDEFVKTSFFAASGRIYIEVTSTITIGNTISAKIFYHGSPYESTHPPWDPGFVWEETPSGKHWVGIACETGGADIWWPCKDHPSDEPDSVALNFTVPDDYVCVSNGRLMRTEENGNGTTTFNWFVSTPINNYNVTFYMADYLRIDDYYASVSGDSIPFNFWILPESYDAAQNHLPVFFKEFHFLETICGPFPFAGEKHGWAHSPYLGMEHQTIIAYGNDFQVNSWGMDYIHLHELTHEWWGNLVTAKDWSDIWIHEGLGTYMEALYVENLSGRDSYLAYMLGRRRGNNHDFPLAPIPSMTAYSAFGNLDPYYRGAWVMHTLRHHLGDKDFFNLLKHWAYPDTSDTDNTDGRLCRLVTTDDMKELAEQVTTRDLNPFFDVFLREASYPHLEIEYLPREAKFSWVTENNVLLDVDIPVSVNGSIKTVEMNAGQGNISIPLQAEIIIDPEQWILMDTPVITTVQNPSETVMPAAYQLHQNFPNPFNPSTAISYQLSEAGNVELSIFDLSGQKVEVLVSDFQKAGYHQVEWNAKNLASGVYIYKIQAGTFQDFKKMILVR